MLSYVSVCCYVLTQSAFFVNWQLAEMEKNDFHSYEEQPLYYMFHEAVSQFDHEELQQRRRWRWRWRPCWRQRSAENCERIYIFTGYFSGLILTSAFPLLRVDTSETIWDSFAWINRRTLVDDHKEQEKHDVKNNSWNPLGQIWNNVKFWTNIEEMRTETFPVDEGFILIPKTPPKSAQTVKVWAQCKMFNDWCSTIEN